MAHPPELKRRAKELRKQGVLIRIIAIDIGVPEPTVIRWLNPELEQRERQKARKKKYARGKKCPQCRRRMSDEAKLCQRCDGAQRFWTRERVIKAIQDWAIEHGYAPVSTEWERSGHGHPAISSFTKGPNPLFKTWGEALVAAGFEPNKKRSPKWAAYKKEKSSLAKRRRNAEVRRQVRERRIKTAIAKENSSEHATGVRDDAGVPDAPRSKASRQ